MKDFGVQKNSKFGLKIKRILGVVPIFFVFFPVPLAGQTRPAAASLRVLLDSSPLTLNPRMTLDLTGQRISALLYRGLTRMDENLKIVPDLAESWRTLDQGKTWQFRIRSSLKDHAGLEINADRIAQCLEEYRMGKPTSPIGARFLNWQSTKSNGTFVELKFSQPNPFLPTEVSSLRYFTAENPERPCQQPMHEKNIVGSGIYQFENWTEPFPQIFKLEPMQPGYRRLELQVVRDETSRVMKLLNGESDAVQNALSLTKTKWIAEKYPERFQLFVREGVNVSYLAFNLRHPILSKKEVRLAIANAIDRKAYVRFKLFGFAEMAGSILSPLLPESVQSRFSYHVGEAKRLLDLAGFPQRRKGQARFQLRYKTTPVREGIETALFIQNSLRKVGIELVLEVVEPAVHLASVRKGDFEIYASRWVGVADGSILFSTLHSSQKNNRAGYRNPKIDQILQEAMIEMSAKRRKKLFQMAQLQMSEDLPYFPLWFWTNAVVMRRGLAPGLKSKVLSLKGSLEPLGQIR